MKKKFAKKSLGQNFLQSISVREKIIEEAGNIFQYPILEIGPGLGFLTTKLLQAKAQLTALEFDARSVEILQRDFGHMPHFRLLKGDILQANIDTLFPNEKYAVIANIPYNITAPILRKLFSETKNKPQYAILMVQKEVAEKICHPTKRSLLSISLEIYAVSRLCFEISRIHFSPIPKVDSAVIRLQTRSAPLIAPSLESDFFTVVAAGFSQKRKKIGNFLGGYFGVSSSLLLGNIDPNLRSEKLTIDDWICITHNFQKYVSRQKK